MKLPQNIGAERALLGAVLAEPERFDGIRELIPSPAAFINERNSQLWIVLLAVVDGGHPIDATFIKPEAERRGWWGSWPKFDFLSDLVTDCAAPSRAADYAREVARVYRHRLAALAVNRLAVRLAGNGQAGGPTIDEVILATARELTALADPTTAQDALRLTCAADVEQRPLAWLWPGRIPLGKLTTLMGNPKLGKSVFLLDLAARVSRGAGWPDSPDAAKPEPADVLIFSAEDDPEDTIVPRLAVALADLRRIHLVSGVTDPQEKSERCFRLDRDLHRLEAVLEERPGIRLVIIDPVSSFLGDVDSHVNAEVRGALAPLAMLAAKHRAAVVCLTHLTKAGTQKAIFRALGSVAFSAVSRAVLAVAEDPQNPARRLLLNAGGNLSAKTDGLAFALHSADSNPDHPVVAWEAEPITISADEVLSPPTNPRGPKPDNRQEAVEWLRAALADGPRPARDLEEEAREVADIAPRTLRRARAELGVVSFRERVPGPWMWALPGGAGQGGQVSEEPGHLEENPPVHEKPGHLGHLAKTPSETSFFDPPKSKMAKMAKFPREGG